MDPEPKEQQNDVEFKYDGKRPKPNLLDYRYMQIEMSRRADTGKFGLSVLALVLLILSCLAVLYIWQILA